MATTNKTISKALKKAFLQEAGKAWDKLQNDPGSDKKAIEAALAPLKKLMVGSMRRPPLLPSTEPDYSELSDDEDEYDPKNIAIDAGLCPASLRRQ